MDETTQFVSDLNVARFVDRLQLEEEPTSARYYKNYWLKRKTSLAAMLNG